MNQEQPKGFLDDARKGAALASVVIQILATSVQPFLHCRFGERYLGLQALAVLALVPVYSLFWEGHNVVPLMYFMGAYLAMCLVARIGVMVRCGRSQHEHSYYAGYPRIMRLLPWMKEAKVKGLVEPLFVLFTGVAFCSYSEPLGCYLMIAAFGLAGHVELARSYERTRAMDMNDAMIEQQNIMERFRELRGDRL